MVMNTPGGNTVSTAQLAMSLLCALARNIPAADMSIKSVRLLYTLYSLLYCVVVRAVQVAGTISLLTTAVAGAGWEQGKWDRKSFTGIEMQGKTLGVIGCGRIGQEVAKCAAGMGMSVLGYDPVMTAAAFQEAGLTQADLPEIYRRADFITVHTPMTPETRNLLNETTLMQCKKGGFYLHSPSL